MRRCIVVDKKQKIALILLPILAIVILAGGVFIANKNKGDAKTYTDGIYIGEGKGFGGTIKVEVEVSGGRIASIDLLEHDESAGISDPAIDAIPQAIIDAQDTEVDIVSEATRTSNGIMEAVENALAGEPGESQKDKEPAPPKEEEKEPEKTQDISDMNLADGTYEGTGRGFGGDIKVEVGVEDGKVANIEILDHDETKNIAGSALEEIPESIIDAQSVEIDNISGATISSKGIKAAVMDALTKAITKPSYEDGTYEGTGRGFGGDIRVEVEVKDTKIVSVEILEHDETPNISDSALEEIPKAIIEAQDMEVETVSGATATSKGIIKAVEDALK